MSAFFWQLIMNDYCSIFEKRNVCVNNQMNYVICEKPKHHFVIYTIHDKISQCMHKFVAKLINVFHFILLFQCWFVEIGEQTECENHNYKFCEQCQFASFWPGHWKKLYDVELNTLRLRVANQTTRHCFLVEKIWTDSFILKINKFNMKITINIQNIVIKLKI